MLDRSTRKFLSVMLFFVVLSSCGVGSSAPNDADIQRFYQENKSTLTALVEFCANHKYVKWVGRDPGHLSLTSQSNGSIDVAVSTIRKKMEDLDIQSLACTRDRSLSDPPLVSVTIPLYAVGLSVSGSSKGLKYITEEAFNVRARVDSGELRALEESRWYIYSQTN